LYRADVSLHLAIRTPDASRGPLAHAISVQSPSVFQSLADLRMGGQRRNETSISPTMSAEFELSYAEE